MHAYLPPVEALAVQQHLEKAAQSGPVDEHDARGHDERMADALIGAVLGTAPGDPSTPLSPKVLLNVFVPLPTLLALRAPSPAPTPHRHRAGGQRWARSERSRSRRRQHRGVVRRPRRGDDRGRRARSAARRPAATPRPRRVLETLGAGTRHRTPHGPRPRTIQTRPSSSTSTAGPETDTAATPAATAPAIRCDLDHLCAWCTSPPRRKAAARPRPTSPAECRRHHRGKTLGILTVTGDANDTLTWTDQHGQHR